MSLIIKQEKNSWCRERGEKVGRTLSDREPDASFITKQRCRRAPACRHLRERICPGILEPTGRPKGGMRDAVAWSPQGPAALREHAT